MTGLPPMNHGRDTYDLNNISPKRHDTLRD
jgi:hypothetical protein